MSCAGKPSEHTALQLSHEAGQAGSVPAGSAPGKSVAMCFPCRESLCVGEVEFELSKNSKVKLFLCWLFNSATLLRLSKLLSSLSDAEKACVFD